MKTRESICSTCKIKFNSIFRNKRWVQCCSRSCSTKLGMFRTDKVKFGEKISSAIKKRIEDGLGWSNHSVSHSKESKVLMRKRAVGKHVGKKNGMFGRRHSRKSREAMSKTKAQRFVEGRYKWKTRLKSGSVFSSKLQKEVWCRSSWEKRTVKMLDEDRNVITFIIEPLSLEYFYKQKRHYVPDFLVSYSNGRKILVEIKPVCHVSAKINLAKFAAAREYCQKNNLEFQVWTQKELGL